MRFETGIYEDGKFRAYDVNEFIRQLSDLSKATYKDFRAELDVLAEANDSSFNDIMQFKTKYQNKVFDDIVRTDGSEIRGNGWSYMDEQGLNPNNTELALLRRAIGYKLRLSDDMGRNRGLQNPIEMDTEHKLPKFRHTNFYTNGKRMFDWFINDPELGEKYVPTLKKGHIYIQFYYYVRNENIWEDQYVDTHMIVTSRRTITEKGKQRIVYDGHLDTDQHLPYVLDHWCVLHYRKLCNDKQLVYLMSPDQYVCTGIIDKLRQILSVKRGRADAMLLKNAIDQALLKDKQPLESDFNKQMQIISRVKIIPLNGRFNTKNKLEYQSYANGGSDNKHAFKGSHWFNWFDKQYKHKSYSDVFSNDTKFDIDHYRYTIRKLKLSNTYISEKNMNEGIFCLDNTDFKKFLLDNDKTTTIVSHYASKSSDKSSNVDSVFFMTNGNDIFGQDIVCTIVDIDRDTISKLDYINKMKKVMQRYKLVVCNKYSQEMTNDSSIVEYGNELGSFTIDRFKRYLATSIDKTLMNSANALDSWAVVGFLEQSDPEVENVTFEQYQDMSPAELTVFNQKLDGISCDAWSTYDFSKGMLLKAKRTYTVNCSRDELSQNLRDKMKMIDSHYAGESVGLPLIKIQNNNYKIADTLAYYSAECPQCSSRMVEGDTDYVQASTIVDDVTGEIIHQGRLSPWSKAFFCPVCNHHELNDKVGHVNAHHDYAKGERIAKQLEQAAIHNPEALVKANFIGERKNGYKSIAITGYKEHDDGFDLHVYYTFTMDNARVTGGTSLLKAVLATRNDEFIGKAEELTLVDPLTGEERKFYDVQLDMLLPGGAVKAKDKAIMNGAIALNNAIFGTESKDKVFSINPYVEKHGDLKLKELNEKVIRNFKRVPVVRKVWKPRIENGVATGSWETIKQNLYVGLISIAATEIGQEFNNTYSLDNPRKFSLNNCDHMQQLGFDSLYESVYDENLKSFGSGVYNDVRLSEINSELLKILGCLMHPVSVSTDKFVDRKHLFKYIEDIKDNDRLNLSDFQQDFGNVVKIANWIRYSDYQDMIRTHPLYTNDKFANGAYGQFVFTDKQTVRDRNGKLQDRDIKFEYHLRFPTRKLLNSMADISCDGMRARFNDIYTCYMSLFQQLSTAMVGTDGSLVTNGQYQTPVRTALINKLKSKIIDHFMTKKGQFAVNSALNLSAIGSKQIGSPLVPWHVVVIPNKANYRKVVQPLMEKTYNDLDLEQDYVWQAPRRSGRDYDKWSLDNCAQFKDVYGYCHRDPVLWRQQNYWCQIWSLERANHEFLKMYGYTYEELFPGSEAIMLNSVRMVIDQESDIDGDWVCVGIPPQYPHIVKNIKDYIEESNHNGFFQPEDHYEDLKVEYKKQGIEEHTEKYQRLDKYKVLSAIASKPRFEYLKDEMGDLYRKYPDELFYDLSNSVVGIDIRNDALLDSAEAKKDIGYLTTSMRYFTYVLNYLKDLGLRNPDKYMGITDELEIMTTFVFQYMLVQREAVRAVKADGSYGKLTIDAIIKNDEVKVPMQDGSVEYERARDLFRDMLMNFDDDYGTQFAWQQRLTGDDKADLVNMHKNKIFDVYELIIHICENFMIMPQDVLEDGGGYVRTYTPEGYENIILDRGYPGVEAQHISKDFKDLKGVLHMVIGNSYKQFVQCFSEVSLFNGIYSGVLNKVPLLKKVGKDISSLIERKKR